MAALGRIASRSLLLLAFIMLHSGLCGKLVKFNELYLSGIEAYNQERWFQCKTDLQQAIKEYRSLQEDLTLCRVTCHKLKGWAAQASVHPELAFTETALSRSDCLRRCRESHLKGLVASPEVLESFANRMPYDYLQICAFKVSFLYNTVSTSASLRI